MQPARLGEYDSTVISSREPRRGDAAMSMLDGESISAALRPRLERGEKLGDQLDDLADHARRDTD